MKKINKEREIEKIMVQEKITTIIELAKNERFLNSINNLMALIENNEYDKIDAVVMEDFAIQFNELNENLRNELSDNINRITDIFINGQNLDNETLNSVYDDLQEMAQKINMASKRYSQNQGKKLREKFEQTNLIKSLDEQFKGIENQYLDAAIFLSNVLNKNGERVYTDEWLLNKLDSLEGRYEIIEIANSIKTLGSNISAEVPEESNNKYTNDDEKYVEQNDSLDEEYTNDSEKYVEQNDSLDEEYTNDAEMTTNENEKEQTNNKEKKYEIELDEAATMQNYRNSGYGQNVYGWYFDATADEYIEGYNPLEDDLYQAYRVYEIVDILDKEATMQNYRNSGYGQNAYGWYFDATTDEYVEGYNPLDDDLYQVFKQERKFVGIKNANELKDMNVIDKTNDKNNTEDNGKDNPDDNDNPDDTSDSQEDKNDDKKHEYTYEEAIEVLKDSLDAELEQEEIDDILAKIDKFFIKIFNKEEAKFENELKNAHGVGNKLKIVEAREKILSEYEKIYDHSNENIKNILKARKDVTLNKALEIYNTRKSNGEYCWKEFKSVKSALNYIVVCIGENKEAVRELDSLIKDMQNVISNPTEEKYNEWQNKMNDFTQKHQLDYNQMAIYFTAEAKEINKDLSVDNEYNINGLNINKTNKKDNDNKKRRKVTAFQKIKNWAKEHKLVCIALGLALAGGTLMLIPQTHMMINSALWLVGKKLGFSAASLTTLNGINQALVKGVAGGKYAFHAASGLYTLGGTGGANALYNACGAKLVGALEGLLVGGAVGTGLTAIVKSIANKIKKNREDKKTETTELKNEVVLEENNEHKRSM